MVEWFFIVPPAEVVEKKKGRGSGHWGHKGRPGKVGGSQPGKGEVRAAGERPKRDIPEGKFPKGWGISPATKNAYGPLGFEAKAKQLVGHQWEARGHAPSAKYHKSTELPGTVARAETRRRALAESVKLILRKHKRLLDKAKEIVAEHDRWVEAAPNAKERRAREQAATRRFVW